MFAKFLVAAVAIPVLFSGDAEARGLRLWWLQDQQYDQQNYDPYYDDQTSIDERELFNQQQYDLYMREMGHPKRRKFQQSYYEPQLAQPKPVRKLKAKPRVAVIAMQKPKIVAPPKPAPQVASLSNRFENKIAPKMVDCTKGAAIVSSYGFNAVSTKSCNGTVLVYNAMRSGKNFEINLNAATGELTNVKRL
jgi:hypothetical protein